MAKGRAKENLSNRKITDSFQVISRSSSFRAPSSPPSSPVPVKALKQTQLSASHFKPTQKSNHPPSRADPEVIQLSSRTDSASRISISRVVVVGQTIPDKRSTSVADYTGAPVKPLLRVRKSQRSTNSVPPLVAARARASQMRFQQRVSPHRRPKLQLSKANAPIKRKFQHESDSDEDIEEIAPANSSQRNFSRPFSLSPSPSGTLATRTSHHDTTAVPEKLESQEKGPSPKKPRLSSPEPCVQPPSSGHEADVEEVIPSSQSDEQELTPSKVIKRRLSDVNEAVQKWRASSLLASPGRCRQSPSPQHEALSTVDFDGPSDFVSPMDTDDHITDNAPAELPVPSTVYVTQGQTLVSETEVGQQLDSSSEFNSPVDASSGGPTVPSSPWTNGKDTTPPLPQSPVFPFGVKEDRLCTPPRDIQLARLPPTPVALDAESKAAKIIAEIKAKALAAAPEPSSDEESDDLELNDLDDSSDEDLDDSFLKPTKENKGKGKAVVTLANGRRSPGPFSSPLSALSSRRESPEPRGRYNLRRHSPPATVPSHLVAVSASLFNAKKRKSTNPLDLLLKEKTLKDKGGKGMDALRAAEASLDASSSSSSLLKDLLKSEMDEEDSNGWFDEDAAQRVAYRVTHKSVLGSSGFGADDASDDEAYDDDLLQGLEKSDALKDGSAVRQILAKDRKAKNVVLREKRPVGIALWASRQSSMEVGLDEDMLVDDLPPLRFGQTAVDQSPLLALLERSVAQADLAQVTLLLSSGSLPLLEPRHLGIIRSWLFEIAISPSRTTFSDPAYHILLNCRSSQGPAFELTFDSVLGVLHRLGADHNILKNMGWDLASTPDAEQPGIDIQDSWRTEVLYRLTSLITISARTSGLRRHELPDTIAALMLIALDRSTAIDLRTDIMVSFEEIGCALFYDMSASLEIESLIGSKLMELCATLSLTNRALLVTSIIGGCPSTSRIARWLARSILLSEDTTPRSEPYCPLPSLSPILALLSPAVGSGAMFDLHGNADKDDYYEDLLCAIAILGKALTDLDGYVTEETQNVQLEMPSPSKSGTQQSLRAEKSSVILEQIKNILDVIHGKIVDTRAAHLDRSRAKAALQKLAFRIHHQRMASARSNITGPRPRNLKSYFSRPRPDS